MTQREDEHAAKKTQPEPEGAPTDRELSDGELETVAGGKLKWEPPPPPMKP